MTSSTQTDDDDEIRKIHDTATLQAIQESLETVATLDDIRRIYTQHPK